VDVREPNERDTEPGGAGGGHGHVFYILNTLWPGGCSEPDERDAEPGGAGGGHGHVFYTLYTLWPGGRM
jgi:hypothetical protein